MTDAPPVHFVLLWGPSTTSGEPCKLVFLLHVFTFETLQLHLIHRVIAPRRVNSGLGARAGRNVPVSGGQKTSSAPYLHTATAHRRSLADVSQFRPSAYLRLPPPPLHPPLPPSGPPRGCNVSTYALLRPCGGGITTSNSTSNHPIGASISSILVRRLGFLRGVHQGRAWQFLGTTRRLSSGTLCKNGLLGHTIILKVAARSKLDES